MAKKNSKKNDRKQNAGTGPDRYLAVVDTPKGSRNKYKFDEKTGRFKLGSVLTAGAVFPYDFGYLPETSGEDGDALDVLILMDEPAFVGCQVEIWVIGAVEAEQTFGDAGEGGLVCGIHGTAGTGGPINIKCITTIAWRLCQPLSRVGGNRLNSLAIGRENHPK